MKQLNLFLILSLVLLTSEVSFAKEYKPLYQGFPSIRESKAYQKFAVRPLSDFSKILYLIDRYGESQISIVYDNQNYHAAFATTVARWFLARNYKKQTPVAWVNQWCRNSILTNRPIHVKLPDGKFLLAKDILLDEIIALEHVIKENQNLVAATGAKVAEAAEATMAKPVESAMTKPVENAMTKPNPGSITSKLTQRSESKNLAV